MPPTHLCPGRELLEVIRASGQEGRLGVSPCPVSSLESEAVSWPIPPSGPWPGQDEEPRSPDFQGSPQASGLSAVSTASCPLEMLCGQGLGALGAADRRLRSHFGIRHERREPRLPFH